MSKFGENLPDDKLDRALNAARRIHKAQTTNALEFYEPYDWQKKFHLLGSTAIERMLMAPSQSGKTLSAAAETAMHLTGRYPDWWEGKRYSLPIKGWCMGVDYKQLRGAAQRLLLGDLDLGTGMIPEDALIPGGIKTMQGAPGNYDYVSVRHISGGTSVLYFKTYEQGRGSMQGETVDFVWMDEEPEKDDLFNEIIARLMVRGGILIITYTPLLGQTTMTNMFYDEKERKPHRKLVQVSARGGTIPHMDERARKNGYADAEAMLKARYSPHEWRARIDGLPALGQGAVFPFMEDKYVIPVKRLPSHTRYIAGIDYGIGHPTAFMIIGWDPDEDVVYFVQEYCLADKTVAENASWINRNFPGIRLAWPHDMGNREGNGRSGRESYKAEGCNMCPEYAQYADERKNGLEDSVWDIYQRIEAGQLKVFDRCHQWLTEARSYHRDDKNKIVPRKDDTIAASRYAVMMLRFSQPMSRIGRTQQSAKKDTGGVVDNAWWLG